MAFKLAEGYVDVPVRHGALDRGLSTAKSKVQRFSAQARSIFLATGAAAAAIGAGLGYAAKGAADFESGLAQIQKVTDKETMEGIRQPIKDMAEEIPLTHKELTKLAEDAGRLGVSGSENITNFVKTAARMGTATTVATDEAGTSFARLANSLDVPIEKAENMGSAVNELSNNVAATSDEIISSMLRAAPAAGQLEMKFSDVAAISATLVASGMRVARAGTRTNQMLSRLSERSGRAAEQIGITEEAFVKMLDNEPTKAVQRLSASLMDIESQSQRVAKANDIVGQAGGKVLSLLAKNHQQLSDNINLSADSYSEATSLTREFNIEADTTGAKLTILQNKWENVRLELGKRVIPKFRSLMDATSGLLDGVNDFIGSSPRMTDWLVDTATIAGTAAGGIAVLSGAVWGLTAAIGVLGGPVTIAIGAIAGLSVAGSGLYNIFKDNTKAADEQAAEADKLADRYEKLASKTDKSTADEIELRQVTERLKELFPKYADELDGTAESLDRLDEAQTDFFGGASGMEVNLRQLKENQSEEQDLLAEDIKNRKIWKSRMESLNRKIKLAKEHGYEPSTHEKQAARAARKNYLRYEEEVERHRDSLEERAGEMSEIRARLEGGGEEGAEADQPDVPDVEDIERQEFIDTALAGKQSEKVTEKETAEAKKRAQVRRQLQNELAMAEASLSDEQHAVEKARIKQWYTEKKRAIQDAYNLEEASGEERAELEEKQEKDLATLKETKEKKLQGLKEDNEKKIQNMREAGVKRISAAQMRHEQTQGADTDQTTAKRRTSDNAEADDGSVAKAYRESEVVTVRGLSGLEGKVDKMAQQMSEWKSYLMGTEQNTRRLARGADSGKTPGEAKRRQI